MSNWKPDVPAVEVRVGSIYIADVPVTMWTRIRDLFRRPWTKAELADRVALSVANTFHRPWPWWPRSKADSPPVVGTLRHSFTPLTAEEIAERDANGKEERE